MAQESQRICKKHGETRYKFLGNGKRGKSWQCVACMRERQRKCRVNKKLILAFNQ